MHALLCALAGVLSATLVVAQQTAAAPAAPQTVWQSFQREHPGAWQSQWCAATGTPSAIYGPGLPLQGWREDSLDEARRHGDQLLQRYRDLLGLGDCEWREGIGARMGQTWVLVYDQFHRGLPVVGGRADLRIHRSGHLALLGSTAVPIPPDLPRLPKIDEANAVRLAWMAAGVEPGAVPQPGKPRSPRLVVWADLHAASLATPCLCWEVPTSAVDQDGQGPIGRYFVDAIAGKVLHYQSDKHECGLPGCHGDHAGHTPLPPATYTVMAYARTGLAATDPLTNVPMRGLEVSIPGLGTVVTDQNGQFVADLTAPTAVTFHLNGVHNQLISGASAPTATVTLQPGTGSTIQLLGSAATVPQAAHTTCYDWVWQVNEFARSILGNSSQLATADLVAPRVNASSTCNAYYTNNTINFYAAGGSCNNTAFSTVIAHEWGHGLDDLYGGISQTQGLSEGWSDILAMYLVDDPVVGAAFYTNGGFIRTGDNTRQYPPPAQVHAAGEVFMGFAWKFRQILRTAYGAPTALTVSNQVVLGSIVANAQDQTSAVREVFIADDNDGNLSNGVPHYHELEAACLLHNLPYPVRQLGTLTHTALTNTSDQLVPRTVRVLAAPNLGSLTAVRLHYHDGVARQRAMVPTGNANEYEALLPGVLAPGTISYHIEADHTAPATLRLPATGEYSFSVVGATRVFLEDFETGAPGWTHAMANGEDDWQIGPPTGRSGPGWSDPSQAFSGSNCAGNDLGLPGDGAYGAAVTNWLRSPPIDCSSYTGMRLRFSRWLTVDTAARDQVFLVVNGIYYVWLNSGLGPTIDTAWTPFELAIPAADRGAAVTVEFRLRSDALGFYGGWNVDDVELLATNLPVAMPVQLRLLPEQALQGAPMQLSVQTPGPRPFLLLLGDTPGPTLVPGVPPLLVGGSMASLGGFTDAGGSFGLGFAAPSLGSLASARWYTQVLTLDAGNNLLLSNQGVNLFTR